MRLGERWPGLHSLLLPPPQPGSGKCSQPAGWGDVRQGERCRAGGGRVGAGCGRLAAVKPGCWQGCRVRPVKPLPGTTVAPLACTGPSSHLTSPARSTSQTSASDHTRPPSNLPQPSLANLPIYPVNQVIKFFVLLCTISNQ